MPPDERPKESTTGSIRSDQACGIGIAKPIGAHRLAALLARGELSRFAALIRPRGNVQIDQLDNGRPAFLGLDFGQSSAQQTMIWLATCGPQFGGAEAYCEPLDDKAVIWVVETLDCPAMQPSGSAFPS